MTDLERRALLGDRKAQEECTRKGIVLPCPFCGGAAFVKTLKQDYGFSGTSVTCLWCRARVYQLDKRVVITEEEAHDVPVENHKYLAIKQWNTRPAPPVGRCKDCANWYKQHCASGPCATEQTGTDFFCGNFEPKSQLKELADLQPLDGVGSKEGTGKNRVPGTAPERSSDEH